MISTKHPSIDFVIGEYNTSSGVDLLVEYKNKGIPSYAWVEIVVKLENLYAWSHPIDGIHKVVCYELGKVQQKMQLPSGKETVLTKKTDGRYHLGIGGDSVDVYVLKELLTSESSS
jgi:hypothetical protein